MKMACKNGFSRGEGVHSNASLPSFSLRPLLKTLQLMLFSLLIIGSSETELRAQVFNNPNVIETDTTSSIVQITIVPKVGVNKESDINFGISSNNFGGAFNFANRFGSWSSKRFPTFYGGFLGNTPFVLSSKTSNDLYFGELKQGDSKIVVNPKTKSKPKTQNQGIQSARFTIIGEENTPYYVSLPEAILMTTGRGQPHQRIVVEAFTAETDSGYTFLDQSGAQTLYIGATRAPLNSGQALGFYFNYFTASFIYP
jgi:hypothetical protein